jgi:hypothetical protein
MPPEANLFSAIRGAINPESHLMQQNGKSQ